MSPRQAVSEFLRASTGQRGRCRCPRGGGARLLLHLDTPGAPKKFLLAEAPWKG